MIEYDSRAVFAYFRLTGSVLPSASGFATLSALLAVLLKMAEDEGFNVQKTIVNNGAIGMYTGTLTFLLVFRTIECYGRFWHCATSMCTFRAQLCEVANNLISFTELSNMPPPTVEHFRRTIVTFISLLHATAVSNVSNRPLKRFPVIDMHAVPRDVLERLKSYSFRNRVDLVYMWLNGAIVEALDTGLLNVPPPILSRVFQQAEKAIVQYNQVLEVMLIPFPFPYAQTAHVLLIVMGVTTPFAMCAWTTHPASAFVMTFIGVICLTSLELIARQLDNPCGEDPNDLPIDSFQDAINESLQLMLSPEAGDVPELTFTNEPAKGYVNGYANALNAKGQFIRVRSTSQLGNADGADQSGIRASGSCRGEGQGEGDSGGPEPGLCRSSPPLSRAFYILCGPSSKACNN